MRKSVLRWVCSLMFAVLFFGMGEEVYGQGRVRVYASSQNNNTGGLNLTARVLDPGRAHDSNPVTFSNINVTALGSVYQDLIFSSPVQGGVAMYIKVGTTSNLLSLLTNFKVVAYKGATMVGVEQNLSSLVNLLSGADQGEILINPPFEYDRVRISYSGVSLGGGLNIFEAYYYKSGLNINCDRPLDILYGANGAIVGGLNTVVEPLFAIDNNTSTFAVLNGTVSLLNKTHLTTLHSNLSSAGDSIHIVLRNPNALLTANLLSRNFTVTTFNDNVSNGALALDESVLQLSLLSSGSQVQVLRYPVMQRFNRIEVSLGGGVLNALQALHLYEIKRVLAKPIITSSEMVDNKLSLCEGDQITLSIQNFIPGRIYKWYDKDMNVIATEVTSTYVPNQAFVYGSNHTFFVSASDVGCSEESDKTKIMVNVLPKGGKPHLTISDVIN